MKAHELLSDPTKWCREEYARTASGRGVFGDNPDAVSFCIYGAIQHCYSDEVERMRKDQKLFDYFHNTEETTIAFNDRPSTTHEMVLNVLKELDI